VGSVLQNFTDKNFPTRERLPVAVSVSESLTCMEPTGPFSRG